MINEAQICAANSAAASWYSTLLHCHPNAVAARRYLSSRGIHADIARQFKLGYAPFSGLYNHLLEAGFSTETQLAAGLITQQGSMPPFDVFRNRIVIPIHTITNNVVGFGGRTLGDSDVKYLNTRETVAFNKSETVFAANVASFDPALVVVEGYMDVIAAHQAGYTNVVSCLGTALTPRQIETCLSLTKTLVIALDGDPSGISATERTIWNILESSPRQRSPRLCSDGSVRWECHLHDVRVAKLTPGMDPDDIIRQNPDQWARIVEQSLPLVDYAMELSINLFRFDTAQGKIDAANYLLPFVMLSPQREIYLQKLSRLLNVSVGALEKDYLKGFSS